MSDVLDFIIENAKIASGHGGIGRGYTRDRIRKNGRSWTRSEIEFMHQNIGGLGYDGIALALNRSAVSVKVKQVRAGVRAPSRQQGWIVANKISKIMNVDAHKIVGWIDQGLIKGEIIPGFRAIRRVKIVVFKMWLVKPESWVYFDADKIQNHHLRRLVKLAQGKWGDRWLSTSEAAAIKNCENADIIRYIKLGRIYGFKASNMSGRHPNQTWTHWFVRESDLQNLIVYKNGKGIQAPRVTWTAAADAFILRCRERGLYWREIAAMMKIDQSRLQYYGRELVKNSAKTKTTHENT